MELKLKPFLDDGEYYNVKVYVTGIKKRCRKTSKESIPLGYGAFTEQLTGEEINELKTLAMIAIHNKMKTFEKAHLYLGVETWLTEPGYSHRVTRYALFDLRNKQYQLEV